MLKPLSCKDFYDPVTSSTDDPAAILTPYYGADAFATHQTVASDLLGAAPFFERPESKAGIMASRNEFSSIRREGK